jgi:hypothetical protein
MQTSSVQIVSLKDFCPLMLNFTISDQGPNLNLVTEFTEEMQRPVARIPVGTYAFQQRNVLFDVVRDSTRIPPMARNGHLEAVLKKVERSFRPLSGDQVTADVTHMQGTPPVHHEPPLQLILPTW